MSEIGDKLYQVFHRRCGGNVVFYIDENERVGFVCNKCIRVWAYPDNISISEEWRPVNSRHDKNVKVTKFTLPHGKRVKL